MADGEVRSKTIVSRKAHACVWCDGDIPAHTRCRFQVYSFDGYLNNCYWHEACVQASYDAHPNQHNFEFDPGSGENPFPSLTELDRTLAS